MRLEHFGRHLNSCCDKDRGPALIRSGKPKSYLYHFNNTLLERLVMMIPTSAPGVWLNEFLALGPVCASCHGYGLAETSRTVALEIASSARTGERYQIDLRGAGIENLVLDVTIVVA
jgi:hypothetical protein